MVKKINDYVLDNTDILSSKEELQQELDKSKNIINEADDYYTRAVNYLSAIQRK